VTSHTAAATDATGAWYGVCDEQLHQGRPKHACTLPALPQRSVLMRKIVDGTPLVIVDHGEWKTELMVKANVLQEDVMAAARQKGVHRLAEIQFAIVERNGQISIFEKC
jgi:uncharacterized membrane protein YcaP (DUF421 family)